MGDDDGNEDDSVILLDGEVSEREEEPANRATPVGRNRNHLQCVVCMEECEVQGEHMPFTLRCGHAFGGSCIRSWLHAGWGTCPTCKQRAESQHLRPLRLPAGAPAVVRDASELEEERKRSGRERERAEKAERELKRAKADLKRAHEQLKHAHAAKRSADPSLPSHDKRPRPAGELVQCSGASAIALRSGILSACACDRVLSAPFNRPGSMVAGAALRGRATCAEAGGEGGERLAAATPDAERGLKVASLSHGSLALEMALPRKPTCLAWHPRDNSIGAVSTFASPLSCGFRRVEEPVEPGERQWAFSAPPLGLQRVSRPGARSQARRKDEGKNRIASAVDTTFGPQDEGHRDRCRRHIPFS